MKRRQFLKTASVGTAAAALASPAFAQDGPEIKWRCTSSFPKSLDAVYGGSELFAKRVAEITNNKFQIQVFAAGEIVPALQAADAVSNNTVEVCHTASYYYVGKDPTFALACACPFGLNSRQQNAWMYTGGGIDLLNEFFAKHNIYALPAGNTGAQMGGWFRKEIKTVADMQGVKMRIAGLAGQVVSKLGMVPQQIAGGDIYPALERGTIDAAEWIGPYDDEKLGFYKVAPYYYYPAWWEGGTMFHLFFNSAKYESLPENYKAAIHTAAAEANTWVQAKYDTENPLALRRLAGEGAQFRAYSTEILDACFKAAVEVYDEISAKNADFKKVYDALVEYRKSAFFWFQFSEGFYDRYMFNLQQRGSI